MVGNSFMRGRGAMLTYTQIVKLVMVGLGIPALVVLGLLAGYWRAEAYRLRRPDAPPPTYDDYYLLFFKRHNLTLEGQYALKRSLVYLWCGFVTFVVMGLLIYSLQSELGF